VPLGAASPSLERGRAVQMSLVGPPGGDLAGNGATFLVTLGIEAAVFTANMTDALVFALNGSLRVC
jgi:hypothetical protein